MTLRAAALLALAAFGVHEARYLLVPDGHAAAGHAYLAVVPVVLALALALAGGRTLARLGRGGEHPALALSWAASTLALLAVHAGQELLERLLAGGGPADAGVLVVVPLCALAGAAVSLLLHRAERLLGDAALPARAPRPVPAATAPLLAATSWHAVLAAGIARNLAGRAPPALG